MYRVRRGHLAAFIMLFLLTGCMNPENWSPVVDAGNDPNAANLAGDTEQCRTLAMQVGANDVSSHSRSNVWTSDGTLINRTAYQHAFSTCLRKRHHPVLDSSNY